MRCLVPFVVGLTVASCSEGSPPPTDAEKIALVEDANINPLEPVELEPLDDRDIDHAALPDEHCAFLPGIVDAQPLFVVGSEIGIYKRAGQVRRVVADGGSKLVAGDIHARFGGLEHAVRLAAGSTTTGNDVPVRLTLLDGRDRIAFEQHGTLDCTG
ncbi:MAG: hypothetical protein HKO05_03395 [Erythrobacter sp.]|jgi:hypothetical protein|nr:hypothetical protein [Erythrobacter sp.]